MKKTCSNCRFYREPGFAITMQDGYWCSNSKSLRFLAYVEENNTCLQFSQLSKKTPLWMRITINALKWMKNEKR